MILPTLCTNCSDIFEIKIVFKTSVIDNCVPIATMITLKIHYLIFLFLLSYARCQDDVEARLSQLEGMFSIMKDESYQRQQDLEAIKEEYNQRQQDLEDRVTKLEELIRIGTLRSCAEYSQYGMKTDGFYQIDPDGPLLGHPPFQVFCNFTSGKIGKHTYLIFSIIL